MKRLLFFLILFTRFDLIAFNIAAAQRYVDSSAAQVTSAQINLNQYSSDLYNILSDIERELCGRISYDASGNALINELQIGANGNYTNCNSGFMATYNQINGELNTAVTAINNDTVNQAYRVCTQTIITNVLPIISQSLTPIISGINSIISKIGRQTDNSTRTVSGVSNLVNSVIAVIANSINAQAIIDANKKLASDFDNLALFNFSKKSCSNANCNQPCTACESCVNNCSASDSACLVSYKACVVNYNNCMNTYNACTQANTSCTNLYNNCQKGAGCYDNVISNVGPGGYCSNYSAACAGVCIGEACNPVCSQEYYQAYVQQIGLIAQDYQALLKVLLAYQPYDSFSFSTQNFGGDLNYYFDPNIYQTMPNICQPCKNSSNQNSSCCSVVTPVIGYSVNGVDCSQPANLGTAACVNTLNGYISYVGTQIQDVTNMLTQFNVKSTSSQARLQAILNQLQIISNDINTSYTAINTLEQTCLTDIKDALEAYGLMSSIINGVVGFIVGTVLFVGTGGLGIAMLPEVFMTLTMIPIVNDYSVNYLSSFITADLVAKP